MDKVVYVVMYTLPGCHPELVAVHESEEAAKNSRDKMNDGNSSLSQKYIVDTFTLEK